MSVSCALVLAVGGCTPVSVQLDGPADLGDGSEPILPLDAALVPAARSLGPTQVCTAGNNTPRYERRSVVQPQASLRYLLASGMMVGDLDGDGLHDLVSPNEPYAQLYRGRDDGGAQAAPELQEFDLAFGAGGSLADYDGDGDLDVFLARFDRPDRLLRNEGGGWSTGIAFTDVTDEAGVGARGPSTSSAWGDMDRDGDLDLFVARYGDLLEGGSPAASLLYENLGDGTFLDRSEHLPAEVQGGWTRMAGWHDLDFDGYPELLVVNDLGDPSVLLWNVNGRLLPDDGRSGFGTAVRGAGLGVGDLNGDGIHDLLVTEWGRMALLESAADDQWFDHAPVRGLVADGTRGQVVPWGAELADVDNDGLLDAVVAFGNVEIDTEGSSGPDWANPLEQPDAVYVQQPDGQFLDLGPELGLDDRGVNRGFVLADVNRDGVLDIVKQNQSGSGALYLSRCTDASWLMVDLLQEDSLNRFAVGATVRVWADGKLHQRSVSAGSTGFGSGGPPELHFGLGEADRVERVEVLWPDGTRSVTDGFDARRRVQISR